MNLKALIENNHKQFRIAELTLLFLPGAELKIRLAS